MTSLEWKFWGVGGGLIGRTIRGGGGGMDIFWNHVFGTTIMPYCLLIAYHLSARSLSVIWIHWNVINFACKRGVGWQHTTFTSYQNAAFSNEFCLWRVDYALEGFVLTKKMWFFCTYYFHTERLWHAYRFSAVIVSGWRDFPSDARRYTLLFALRLKKLISQAPEDPVFKFRRPVYKWLFKSNRVLRADQKSDVNQDLMHSGCCGAMVPNVCLWALILSLPSPHDFFTLSPNRETCSPATLRVAKGDVDRIEED